MLNQFIPVTSFTSFCRLHSDILAESSSILLYLFLRNIFVTSDIKIKEENLFCDNIKGNEIFPSQQVSELKWLHMCWFPCVCWCFKFMFFGDCISWLVNGLRGLCMIVLVYLILYVGFTGWSSWCFSLLFNLYIFFLNKSSINSDIQKCIKYKVKPVVILLPLRILHYCFHVISPIFKSMHRQICYLQKWNHDLLAVLKFAF